MIADAHLPKLKVLVCGGRNYTNRDEVYRALDNLSNMYQVEVISGMAKGADTFGYDWAILSGYPVHEYPAEWSKYGRKAGPIRNQQMLTEGNPDLVLAFSGGTGTAHMTRISEEVGKEVWKYE
jgi:hypothetical protein